MHPFEKNLYDRLVKIQWLDNITAVDSKTDPGAGERKFHWRETRNLFENGEFKLWMFSKIYKELEAGGPISNEDLELFVQLGWAFGVKRGWEKLPPL